MRVCDPCRFSNTHILWLHTGEAKSVHVEKSKTKTKIQKKPKAFVLTFSNRNHHLFGFKMTFQLEISFNLILKKSNMLNAQKSKMKHFVLGWTKCFVLSESIFFFNFQFTEHFFKKSFLVWPKFFFFFKFWTCQWTKKSITCPALVSWRPLEHYCTMVSTKCTPMKEVVTNRQYTDNCSLLPVKKYIHWPCWSSARTGTARVHKVQQVPWGPYTAGKEMRIQAPKPRMVWVPGYPRVQLCAHVITIHSAAVYWVAWVDSPTV